ncbi:MAG: hypothetical protein OXK77_11985 [Gemmatimonadota bacterium]|nr:hypothetical protein [Gemmatimonadota bacterium]MDE2864966.1 hypothetical protein [Gemmatimonadota bacterium]
MPRRSPQALLAHDSDEVEVVVRLDAGFLHGAQHRQEDDQPTRVVAHTGGEEGVAALPDGHVGALREDGVQVAAEPDRAAAASPPTHSDHVAFGVRPHRIRAEFPQQFGEAPSPDFLHEGRRGDFRQFDQQFQRPCVEIPDDAEGVAHRRMGGEFTRFKAVVGRGHLAGTGR